MNPDKFPQGTPSHAGEDGMLSQEQSLQRLVETADYVIQRALQLDEQVQEAEQIVLHLGALARQLRTLSSNTTLEATRMRMSGPLAEIARQMRRISQQISESNDQLGLALRSYAVGTGELRQAVTSMQSETKHLSLADEPDEAGSVALQFMPGRLTPVPPRPATDAEQRRRGRLRTERTSPQETT